MKKNKQNKAGWIVIVIVSIIFLALIFVLTSEEDIGIVEYAVVCGVFTVTVTVVSALVVARGYSRKRSNETYPTDEFTQLSNLDCVDRYTHSHTTKVRIKSSK